MSSTNCAVVARLLIVGTLAGLLHPTASQAQPEPHVVESVGELIFDKIDPLVSRPIKTSTGAAPSLVEARDTIVKAAGAMRQRPWSMSSVGTGRLIGRLDIRKHAIVVEIAHNTQEYSIAYRNSVRMNYDAKHGTIRHSYNIWVKELAESIDREFRVLVPSEPRLSSSPAK
jgi:hypothetical protein